MTSAVMEVRADENHSQTVTDHFRKMEKDVRFFIKASCGGKAFLKMMKKNSSGAIRQECALTVDDFVNVSSPDHRLVPVAGSHCRGTVYRVSEECAPPGLFIISQALSRDEQLHWAQKALEEYSTAEHTNLTNLARQRAPDRDDSAADGDSVSEATEIWRRSIKEDNGLQSFKALRW